MTSTLADAIASNGDTSAIMIGFWADFANHLDVCDLFAAVGRDVVVVDDEEGAGAVDSFSGGIRVGANVLAVTTKFISIRFVPNLVELGVLSELAVL